MLAEWLGSYGIAIIALSFLSFVLLYPFTRKAYQIQQEELYLQKILQEQIKDIKANYSGAEQFDKIQRLYDRYSYHPIMAVRSVFGLLIQLPFLLAVFYMLSNCTEIQGISWGVVPNLGKPDALLQGINLLPFAMAFVSVIYAFIVPNFDKKQIIQTVVISILFLLLLYSAPSALLIFWTCNLLWSLLDSVFNKKIEWLRGFISDNELAFHIIFALALTMGLLVPLEIYIKNASQLWFNIKDILKYFLTDTAKYYALLLFVYVAFWVKKSRSFYLSILLGLLLGVFLQSYVIGIDYGIFDGHEIEWGKYTKEGLLNTFIWLFCLGESFIVFKRLKFDLEKLKKYVKPVTFGIVVIQCIALMYALKNNPLPDNAFRSKDSINVLTTKDMFTISSKDNIIVFLLDAFDAKIFEEIMIKDPDIIKELSGFTFYPDTVSVYGLTDYSLPQILTGKVFLNDKPYVEYFEEAWEETPYYNYLLAKNYDICIYTVGNLVSKTAPISNLISEKTVLNDESMRSFNNLVRFRIAPHYVKKAFYVYDPNAWMRFLANSNVKAYQENDRLFYINLKKGLKYQNDKNSFRFYHLTGAHYPFILDRNLEQVGENIKGTQYEQSVGAMKIVIEYINQMKQEGVFDSSTLVIMADHGEHNKVGSRPLLCVKKPKERHFLQVSREAVSFSYFLPIFFRYIRGETEKPIFHNKRYFYYVDEEKGFVKYQIVGNAKSIDSWIKESILDINNKNSDSLYVLGDTIDFTMYGESFKYKGKGWSKREESLGTWTLASDAELIFKIKDYSNQDLRVSMLASAYLADLPHRTVKVFINGTFITDIVFGRESIVSNNNYTSLIDLTFIIPASLVGSGLLNIHFAIDKPGISVQYEDGRDLGMFVNSLVIEKDN